MRSPLTGPTTTGRRVPRRRSSTLIAVLAVTALVLAGCGSDDGDETTEGESTTETTAVTSSDSDPGTSEASTSEPTTSSAPEGGDTTEVVSALSPGDPCSLEEGLPDCIDPDGDGEGTYLIGGSDCAATAPDISVCEDLDGDGNAGYPDEYEDLPTCSADVAPPCNNPPGSSDDE